MINKNGTIIEESKGTTLSQRERNGYHDSDFFATYWDGAAIIEVCYDSTRGAGNGLAIIDATDEVKEAVAIYKAERQAIVDAKREKRIEVCNNILIDFLVKKYSAVEANAKQFVESFTGRDWIKTAHGSCGVSISYDLRDFDDVSLQNLLDEEDCYASRYFKLLNSNLRSNFRISLRNQVVAWLTTESPKFAQPLSHKQRNCI